MNPTKFDNKQRKSLQYFSNRTTTVRGPGSTGREMMDQVAGRENAGHRDRTSSTHYAYVYEYEIYLGLII